MDPTPEQEQLRSEVVHLDEEFVPFKPESTQISFNKPEEVKEFRSKIILETEALPPLPMNVNAGAGPLLHFLGFHIAPFKPELGYQITKEDYRLIPRMRKMRNLHEAYIQFIYGGTDTSNQYIENLLENGALTFSVRTKHRLNELGLATKVVHPLFRQIFEIKDQETLDLIKRLRFQVDFPDLSLEAKPDEDWIFKYGHIMFTDFYPVDLGPLPKLDQSDSPFFKEGLSLMVPPYLEKLNQITAQFTLAPEEGEKAKHPEVQT